MSQNKISKIVETKNKMMENLMADKTLSTLQRIDKFFTESENSILLDQFNREWSGKSGAFYNPTQKDATKFMGGCTECRTFTDYLITACSNYGCVAEQFVTKVRSSDCNTFVYSSLAKVSTTFDMNSTQLQNTSASQDNFCVPVNMKKIKTFIEVTTEALCSCLGADAVAMAANQMMTKLKLSFDRAILYGSWDANTSTFVSIPNMDSINLAIPVGQKVTSADDKTLYDQIVKVSSSILTNSKCSRDKIRVLMSASAMQRLIASKDSNGRPILSEIRKGDSGCEIQIGCLEIIECNSIVESVNGSGILTTDVFVGIKDHYVFGHYMFPLIESQFQSQVSLETAIPAINYFGGRIDQVSSFYKITATL